jgi:hypothetical protein
VPLRHLELAADRAEACFPQLGEAVEQFRKAAADEGLVELDLLDQLESVHRALESARERLGTMDR